MTGPFVEAGMVTGRFVGADDHIGPDPIGGRGYSDFLFFGVSLLDCYCRGVVYLGFGVVGADDHIGPNPIGGRCYSDFSFLSTLST